MATKLRICRNCGNYSFKNICPKCGNVTSNPHPPSFSPIDKYGKYRRAARNI
ncbi:MAG TPA: RNA-protein complex protein Nop10 [archaeon]|nr:RNA-protein complex protein Nop10 [archaeon]